MKLRLLDLFCGAGGCSKGYQYAGFYVIGVDVKPQPNYCGDEFVQADALEVLRILLTGGTVGGYRLEDFVGIHASPPCQAYSTLKGLTTTEHPALIEPVRELLRRTGLPYVIENVTGAPLQNAIRLCGSSFGLRVWRHRLFELSFSPPMIPCCSHSEYSLPLDVTGTGNPSQKPRAKARVGLSRGGRSRKPSNLSEAQQAMGIDWMRRSELTGAIPPAFTHFVGTHLMAEVDALACLGEEGAA